MDVFENMTEIGRETYKLFEKYGLHLPEDISKRFDVIISYMDHICRILRLCRDIYGIDG